MYYKLLSGAILGLTMAMNAQAAAPSVAVDIAPVHSLVSQVMDGVAQPKLLIPAEASPHYYNLRPSEAKALSDADVVFWIGEGLTPWLEKALDNLASSAQKIEMLEIKETTTYTFREGATFEGHDHDEHKHKKHKHHEEHQHGKHKEEKHSDHHNHHDHEGNDPHAWLDPENAKVWVKHIATILSKKDPENAATYKKNAAQTIKSLDNLITATQTEINKLGNPQFVVFHDAYQYFEKRFGIAAAGAIALSDAEDPSPARIKEIRHTVKKLGVKCVFTEPQYNSGLVKNVFDKTNVTTIGVMDPLGASINIGKDHYSKLINAMTNSIERCK